ncbi:MAG: tetratricopeptide repeat protein [Bacteroidetes bacterium]|nr:tetratricopeptide repeat protein [Bacteroidota bacterium]MBS1740285.1 tetratricopeptide repeat protein [Bacteroidota bacterium]MBS1776469.1 tetratricopeptide repeat protein [Bacteroidota bacterium]
MRPIHFITIFLALALVAILYFGVKNTPPKIVASTQAADSMNHTVHPASFDSLLSAANRELPAHAKAEISTLEKRLSAISDSSKMAVVFDTLARLWLQHKQGPIAAQYFLQEAKLVNSEKKLTFAAQLFLELARKSKSESMQTWMGQQAIEGFKRALQLNPNNDTLKVDLAECFIGTGETMQGVLMLREVTEKHPDNIPANLILGQQGIVSGQFDKAIARFDRVLGQQPENMEALLGLAEAYKGSGQKQKALELLEKAKKLMNNPEFSKDIDDYIKTF